MLRSFFINSNSFCQTCVINEEHLSAEPLTEMDSICRDYVSDKYHRQKPSIILKKLMDDMKKLPITTNSVIFYWALQAKVLYELLFHSAYTYRVLVEPEPVDYDNCVTAFIDGSGFVNTKKPNNMSAVQNETFFDGLSFEKLFTSTVVYIWGLAACNQTKNFRFVRTQ